MHHEWSARLSSGFRMGSGSYSVLVAKRYRQGSCRSLQLLLEEFDEGDDERALREEHAGHPRDELDGLARERESEVHLRHKVRGVQLFQGFGDALGLRAGETFGFEFLDDPVGVDHERLHRSSVYHATSRLQRKDRVMGASRAATALSCFAPSRRRRLGLRRSS